jgi:hypothetical protein
MGPAEAVEAKRSSVVVAVVVVESFIMILIYSTLAHSDLMLCCKLSLLLCFLVSLRVG